MQRDMNLVLAILRHCDANRTDKVEYISSETFGCSQEVFEWHFRMIIERGLASGGIDPDGYFITGLTTLGRAFLDNAENPTVWNIALKAAENASFGLFLYALKEAETRHAMKRISSDGISVEAEK